jgi:glycosyltransferase involved in cell wall biosynthesis
VGSLNRGVLLLTQYFGLGGLERMIFNLLKMGRKDILKTNNILFIYDQQNFTDNLLDETKQYGFSVVQFQKASGFSIKLLVRLVFTLLKYRVSVIHSHDLGPLIYAVLAKCFLGFQLRIIHTQHSFVHLEKLKRYRFYERFFTYFVDELVVVSPDLGYRYLELGVGRRIHCIHNGVDFPEKLPSLIEKRNAKLLLQSELAQLRATIVAMDKIWILYLGRIHSGKGQDNLVRMWAELPKNLREKFALLFVGSITDQEYSRCLNDLIYQSDSENVFMLGVTHQPEKWIKASEVFISISDFEGHPLAPTEALAGGCHLILSRIPGHEVFRNFAELVKINDHLALQAILESIVIDTSKRKYGAGDWNEAQAHWSAAQMYRDYKELYFPYESEGAL